MNRTNKTGHYELRPGTRYPPPRPRAGAPCPERIRRLLSQLVQLRTDLPDRVGQHIKPQMGQKIGQQIGKQIREQIEGDRSDHVCHRIPHHITQWAQLYSAADNTEEDEAAADYMEKADDTLKESDPAQHRAKTKTVFGLFGSSDGKVMGPGRFIYSEEDASVNNSAVHIANKDPRTTDSQKLEYIGLNEPQLPNIREEERVHTEHAYLHKTRHPSKREEGLFRAKSNSLNERLPSSARGQVPFCAYKIRSKIFQAEDQQFRHMLFRRIIKINNHVKATKALFAKPKSETVPQIKLPIVRPMTNCERIRGRMESLRRNRDATKRLKALIEEDKARHQSSLQAFMMEMESLEDAIKEELRQYRIDRTR